MSIRKVNMPYPLASDNNDLTQEIEGSQRIYRTIPSPSDVKKLGLVGVPTIFPLTSEPISDDYISLHLETAIQELEFAGLNINQKITTQMEDMYEGDMTYRFNPFTLNNFPVLEIESIKLVFPNAATETPYAEYLIPPEWYFFDGTRVSIVATSGSIFPTFNGYQGQNPIPLTLFGAQTYRPGTWRVTYLCGFEADKIPTLIYNLIIDKATVSLLNDLGPLMFSVNSYTTGVDQLTQGVTMPGPKIFESRIAMLEKRIRKNFVAAQGYYGCAIKMQFAGR
jgi:hypothetical protein